MNINIGSHERGLKSVATISYGGLMEPCNNNVIVMCVYTPIQNPYRILKWDISWAWLIVFDHARPIWVSHTNPINVSH